MITHPTDFLDTYISGLLYEVRRELDVNEHDVLTPSLIGEKVEKHIILSLTCECQLPNPRLLEYVESNSILRNWYEENHNRYSDYFLENLPLTSPYTSNPEKYANIFGNLASQMIGVVYGNIREDGING